MVGLEDVAGAQCGAEPGRGGSNRWHIRRCLSSTLLTWQGVSERKVWRCLSVYAIVSPLRCENHLFTTKRRGLETARCCELLPYSKQLLKRRLLLTLRIQSTAGKPGQLHTSSSLGTHSGFPLFLAYVELHSFYSMCYSSQVY